jgi:hypothetical protein
VNTHFQAVLDKIGVKIAALETEIVRLRGLQDSVRSLEDEPHSININARAAAPVAAGAESASRPERKARSAAGAAIPAAPAGAGRKPRSACYRAILDYAQKYRAFTKGDIIGLNLMPEGSVGPALFRLTEKGILENPERGHYRLPSSGAASAPSAPSASETAPGEPASPPAPPNSVFAILDRLKIEDVKPLDAAAIEIGRSSLPAQFTATDLGARVEQPRAYRWIAVWKDKGWVETVAYGVYRRTEDFGK